MERLIFLIDCLVVFILGATLLAATVRLCRRAPSLLAQIICILLATALAVLGIPVTIELVNWLLNQMPLLLIVAIIFFLLPTLFRRHR